MEVVLDILQLVGFQHTLVVNFHGLEVHVEGQADGIGLALVLDVEEVEIDFACQRLVLNVNVIARKASGESGVLPLFANGQRELVVWHNYRGAVGLHVHHHAGHPCRRERVGNVGCRVVAPLYYVHTLTTQLSHHGTYAATLGSNACAHGIGSVYRRRDGHL